MNPPISTLKLLQQRNFFASLIPLVALFVGLGATQTARAQRYTSTDLTISASPTGGAPTSTTYGGLTGSPKIDGADLGSGAEFDQTAGPSQGRLTLTAASTVTNSGGATITSAAIYYRVYLQGASTLPGFSRSFLNVTSTSGNNVSHAATMAIDLLNQPAVLGGGTYAVEIYFRGEWEDGALKGAYSDPASSNNIPPVGYKASFKVKIPLITPVGGTTTWLSTSSTNWNLASNWSNGVPTASSNAVIPAPANGIKYTYPVLDSPVGGPTNVYSVNNLTLEGTSGIVKAELFVQTATLAVYGNIRQLAGGLRGVTIGSAGVADPTKNATLILAGGDQIISGQLNMPDVVVAGSGAKSIINVLLPTNTLSFQPASVANGVVIQSAAEDNVNNAVVTTFNTTGNTYITLGNTGIINQVPGYSETNSSYIKGVLRSTRRISAGNTESFGNVGLEMTPNHTPVGQIVVVRVVGDPQQAPVSNTNGGVAIRRFYTITGDDDSETSTYAGSGSRIGFRYLDSAIELNTIEEQNLLMFLSFNIAGPYAPTPGDLDVNNNLYTRPFLASYPAYNLTLGDRTRPLPVTLSKFAAKRLGADVLVTWQTASEQNSKGFEVQVSTNSTDFRTVATVASTSANSSSAKSYSYLDTERGKVGMRYYRLRQIDLDGKDAYFAPVAVSFDGKATTAGLVAYPNPFNGSEPLHLALTSAAGGSGQLRITDLTGHTIRQEAIELATGLTDFSVTGLTDLKAGIYIVSLVLPTGEVKNLKVIKQ